MNEKMWSIFEKTGSIEAYLYIEESKRMNMHNNLQNNMEASDELTYLEHRKEKENEH